MEKRLLGRAQFEKMLAADDFGQLHAILKNAGYQNFPARGVGEVRFHAMLHEFLADFLDEVLHISPPTGNEYLDILFLDYDLHNIQAALMRRQAGAGAGKRTIPLPRERARRYAALLEGAQTQDEGDYYTWLLRQAEEKFQIHPRTAQEWLDKEYYRRLIALAEGSGSAMFLEYARTKVDFYNLLSLLRIRRLRALSPALAEDDALAVYAGLAAEGGALPQALIAPLLAAQPEQIHYALEDTVYRRMLTKGLARYGRKNDTALLEKEMDDALTRIVKAGRYTTVGCETLFGYLYARRIEMTNLHLILAVRVQGLPVETARERLREEYV